jgi:cold shock protein
MKQTRIVEWFNTEKGYRFIKADNAKQDVFVHHSRVKAAKLSALNKNQRIEFDVEEKQGKDSAINIKKIGN